MKTKTQNKSRTRRVWTWIKTHKKPIIHTTAVLALVGIAAITGRKTAKT